MSFTLQPFDYIEIKYRKTNYDALRDAHISNDLPFNDLQTKTRIINHLYHNHLDYETLAVTAILNQIRYSFYYEDNWFCFSK